MHECPSCQSECDCETGLCSHLCLPQIDGIVLTHSDRQIQVWLDQELIAWADHDDETGWSAESVTGDTSSSEFTRAQIIDVMIEWTKRIQRMRSWTAVEK